MQVNDHIEIQKDGITFLACGKYTEGNNRYVSHLLKDGDKDGIEYAAERMARIIPKNIDAILVPIPGHTGKAIQTKELANAIARRTGIKVADILEGNSRESLYHAKKSGRVLTSDDLGIKAIQGLPKGKIPLIVDNCCDYGFSAKCAYKALGYGIPLVYSITDNIRKDYDSNITREQVETHSLKIR